MTDSPKKQLEAFSAELDRKSSVNGPEIAKRLRSIASGIKESNAAPASPLKE
jgi:hypothetical protein